MRYLYLTLLALITSAILLYAGIDVNVGKNAEIALKSAFFKLWDDLENETDERLESAEALESLERLFSCNFDIALDARDDVTNCNNPNGKLSVRRFDPGGDPNASLPLNAQYDIKWFDENATQVSHNSQASNLDIGAYVVHVTEKATGCVVSKTYYVGVALPNLSAAVITHAEDCNSGASHLRVELSGDVPKTDKYTVNIHSGPHTNSPIYKSFSGTSPMVDHTYGLPVGTYAVTVAGTGKNNCVSPPTVLTIEDRREYPVVSISPIVNNTNCAPMPPNGSLRANVTGGNTGYTFEWFAGNNTLIENRVATTALASNLAAGVYTVRVTNSVNNCPIILTETVADAIVRLAVTANKISDYTNCTTPNGSIAASVNGTTSGFTFNWYIGGSLKATPDFTGTTYSGLINGAYTVTATNNTTGCVSNPVTVNILDARQYPNVTLTPTPNTNCAPAAPNGSISAAVAGGNTGHTFEWFAGGLPISGSPVGTGAVISNRAPGQYSVRVTNSTGCVTTVSTTIADSPATPIITYSKLEQTSCSPANGSITVSRIEENGTEIAPSNYTITLTNSSGTPVTGSNGSFTGLAAGSYTLVAENNTTRCRSAVSTIQILNNTVLPVINVARVPNTSCAPAPPNGSLTASATTGGVVSAQGYSFRWFNGGLPISGSSINNTNAMTGLSGGIFSVEATDLATGCVARMSVNVEDAQATPVVTYNAVPQTFCSPANGSIAITGVTENGTLIPSSQYTFTLTGPNGAVTPDSDGITFSGLVAGTYSLQAENNTSRCRSVVSQINVADNTVLPMVEFTRVNNGSCNPSAPNGSITAAASIPGDPAGTTYTYEWFSGGIPITSTSVIGSGATLSNLAAGQYAVRATNTTTGCFREATTSIVNQAVLPEGEIVSTPETYCTPNGTITITNITEGGTVVSPLEEYNVTLIFPNGSTVSQAGNVPFENLAGGIYYVEIQHSIRMCESVRQQVTVGRAIVYPVLAGTITPQMSCDPNTPNGSTVVTADGETGAPYTFEWYNGNLPILAGATLLHSGNELAGLALGTYSVRVTNTTTGCVVYNSYTVGENIVIPIVTTTTTPLENCEFPDGEIIATLQPGLDPSDYYFYLYEGTQIKAVPDQIGSPAPGETEMVFDNLPLGDYRVVAEHKINKCRSSDGNNIVVSENDDTKTHSMPDSFPAFCESDGGVLLTEASSVVNNRTDGGAGYDFTWYIGTVDDLEDELATKIGDPDYPNLTIISDDFGSTVSGITQGYYTVRVFNRETKCEVWDTEFLPYMEAHELDLDVVNAVSCVDFSNTQIIAIIKPDVPHPGDNFPTSNYEFVLYEGEYASGTSLESKIGIGNNPVVFNGYEPGVYTVVAIALAPPHCPSAPVTITLDTNVRDPLVVLENLEDNSQCGPYNGVIEISVSPDPVDDQTSTYTFLWEDNAGNDVTALYNFNNTNFTSSSYELPPGRYTVTIFNNVTQCSFEESYTVGNNPPEVELTVTPDDQTECNPNGTIVITEILENGSPVALSDYTYVLYDAGFNELASSVDIATFETNFTFEGLAEGAYYVQASHKTTGCSRPSELTIVGEAIVYPDLTLISTTPDESCPGGTPTGALTATVDGGQDHTNPDYTFTWYDSNNNPIGSESTLSGIGVGYYTLVVENTATGCSVSAEYYVPFYDTYIQVFAAEVPSAVCYPDGQASFTVRKDGVDESDLSNYTFTLVYPDGTSAVVSDNPTALEPGDYYVTVTHNSLNCVSDMVHFEIRDTSVNPEILVVQTDPDMSCDQTNPTGRLEVAEVDGDNDFTNYTFTWYNNNDLVTPVGNDSFIENQPTGTYTVAVYNTITQCTGTAEFVLTNQPADIVITASHQHATKCAPFNGEAFVSSITLNGDNVDAADFANYTFTWISEGGSTTSNIYSWVDLDPGTYYVSAYHTSLHCTSNTVEIIIHDNSEDPVLVITQGEPDISCDGNSPTGSLTVTADNDINGTNPAYTYEWYSGTDHIESGRTITGRAAGIYRVEVYNSDTDCSSTMEFELQSGATEIVVTAAPVFHPIKCDAPFDGIAEVTGIERDGVTESLSDYTFEWFDENFVTIGQTGTTATLLEAGIYYVNATHIGLGCTSEYFRVILNDNSMDPVIEIAPSAPNISCNPMNPTGVLSASVPSVTDYSDYTFVWYNNEDPNTPIAPSATDDKMITNLPAGIYTVSVTYNVTGCTASSSAVIEDNVEMGKPFFALNPSHPQDCNPSGSIDIVAVPGHDLNDYTFRWYREPYTASSTPFASGTGLVQSALTPGLYYVEAEDINYGCTTLIQVELLDESTPPLVTFDMEPQSNCRPGILTGILTAEVDGIMGSTLNSLYEFTWYNGMSTQVESQRRPETEYFIAALDSGFYSVRVRDLATQCISHALCYVRDGRPYPNIEIEITANSNCDPARQTGMLSAIADGFTTNHSFEWYVGEYHTIAELNGVTSFSDQPFIENLSSQWYTVAVINLDNMCRDIMPVFLPDSIELIPAPEANIIAHSDNCVSDNGAISASMNGNTTDYLFNWYRGETSTDIIFTGADITGLAPGIYSVDAVEIATGCSSERVSVEIEDHRVYPVFSVQTKNALCTEPTGSIIITIEPGTEIASARVQVGNEIREGLVIENLPIGEYPITITTTNGCTASALGIVNLDINVYNGVSPNGDGQNDFFIVDCLQDFPNNIVKIFNRAGTLVYEATGYDNKTIYFDGVGNRGVYINNKNVPDGTYFYIVDKRDGSKPKTGYLELSR